MTRFSDMNRREFLKGAATTGAAAGAAWVSGVGLVAGAAAAPPVAPPLAELSAGDAVAAMRAGEMTAMQYAATLLARADALEFLNTIIGRDRVQVLRDAHAADRVRRHGGALGPLHGLPVLFKDNINTTALPTTGGTPALAGNHPPLNSPIVDALLAAGAIVFGKANMHELAFGITSNNGYTGPVRNPYDPSLIAGGSSGGNGAALGARIVAATVGTDTGGSTRIPAALCGAAGFRPTVGRYPGTGDPDDVGATVPISHTRDTPGPMARTVADIALLDAVIAGDPLDLEPADLSGVRLGVARGAFYVNLDPAVAAVIEEALMALADHGATLVEADMPDLQTLNAAVGFPVALFEARRDLPMYLDANAPGVSFADLVAQVASPDVKGVMDLISGPGAIPEAVYLEALTVFRPQLQAAYADYFAAHAVDALVFPTTILPARPIGQDETVELNGVQVPTFPTYIANTDPAGNAGIPGLSIPAGLTGDGLPVGIEFDGPAGSDRALLAIGLAAEAALGPLPAPRIRRRRRR